jgi:hypothetical protein
MLTNILFFLGFRFQVSAGVRCQQRRWSPISQFDRGLNYVKMALALKNTTAHLSWLGRFRSLMIVFWDLFGIWCLQFGFYHRVARTTKLTPDT